MLDIGRYSMWVFMHISRFHLCRALWHIYSDSVFRICQVAAHGPAPLHRLTMYIVLTKKNQSFRLSVDELSG